MKTQRGDRERHVTMEAEIGVMTLPTKGHQVWQTSSTSSEESMEQIFPQRLQKASSLAKTLTLDFCSPAP